VRESRQDVEKVAEAFEFYGGLADKLFGATIPISPNYFNYTLREPMGVTAHIAPLELSATIGAAQRGAGTRVREHGSP